MPYARRRPKRARRTFKRKVRSGRRKPRGTRIVKSGSGLGLPDRMYFKHKYAQNYSLAITSGTPTWKAFSVNSLYTPVSGGHQPYYFDEMSALYNNYTVLGSKITIKCSKYNSAADVPLAVTVYVDDDGTPPSSGLYLTTLMEQGKHVSMIAADDGLARLRCMWSARKTFPGPRSRTDISGTPSSNPAQQQYFILAANTVDETNSGTFYATVEIEYFAMWWEKKGVIGS